MWLKPGPLSALTLSRGLGLSADMKTIMEPRRPTRWGELVGVSAEPFSRRVTLDTSLAFCEPQRPLFCRGENPIANTVDSGFSERMCV